MLSYQANMHAGCRQLPAAFHDTTPSHPFSSSAPVDLAPQRGRQAAVLADEAQAYARRGQLRHII